MREHHPATTIPIQSQLIHSTPVVHGSAFFVDGSGDQFDVFFVEVGYYLERLLVGSTVRVRVRGGAYFAAGEAADWNDHFGGVVVVCRY